MPDPEFDEIWIVKGESGFAYHPDDPLWIATQAHDESMTFSIGKPVAIYGGFVGDGTEDSVDDRVEGAQTVLSGFLAANTRSYHIVTIDTGSQTLTVEFNGVFFDNGGHGGLGGNITGLAHTYVGGGAIVAHSSRTSSWPVLRLRGCEFFGNMSWLNGGAVWTKQWALETRDCVFNANFVWAGDRSLLNPMPSTDLPGYGGAIKHEGAPLSLSRCLFTQNTTNNLPTGSAYEFGGAVYALLEGGSTDSGYIVNCEFRDNVAPGGADGNGVGGALWFNRGESSAVPAYIINCVYADNAAGESGGGLFCSSGCVVNACTFCANVAGGEGGGVAMGGQGTYEIQNSILWDNQDSSGTEFESQVREIGPNVTITISHSCANDIAAGSGNTDQDPSFEAENGNPRDLRLARPSPAADAADNSLRTTDFTDVDGVGGTSGLHPWDLDDTNRFKGCSLDMGAYEAAALTCPADLNGDHTVDGGDLGLLLGSWGACNCQADLNCDDVVDGSDLGLLLGSWGNCPGYGMMMSGGGSPLDDLMAYLGVETDEELVAALTALSFEDMAELLESFLGS